MVTFSLADALPFVDIEADETLTALTSHMSDELIALGIEKLDSALVRGPNRALTRAIATWIYTQVDENDEAIYSGVRYSSRFQSHESWAIFEGVEIRDSTISAIAATDTDLTTVAREFGLTIH